MYMAFSNIQLKLIGTCPVLKSERTKSTRPRDGVNIFLGELRELPFNSNIVCIFFNVLSPPQKHWVKLC